jgi:transposase
VLVSLGTVYSFDTEAKKGDLMAEERLTFHQSNRAPVLDDLHRWLKNQFAEHKTKPNSGVGEANSYLIRHWP